MSEKIPENSIYNYLFGSEPVLEINSPRVQVAGTKAAWDSCVLRYSGGVTTDVDITSSKEKIRERLKGTNIVNHGGISNASSMYRQFPGAKELTLLELECAMNRNETLPYVFDYPDAVKKSIIASGESNFRKAHEHDLSDYLDMTIFEVQQIGKTPESKASGVKPLNWKLVDVSTRGGKEGQTEIALFSQPAPYSSGFDTGLTYIGDSLWDRTEWEITNVGGRGQTTSAQDFGIYRIPEFEIGGKKYVLEGVSQLNEFGKNAINDYINGGFSGVEIVTQTWIENRIPRAIVPLRAIFIK